MAEDAKILFVPGAGTRPLLLLHGTGGTAKDLLPIGHFLAPEAPLLSIGAPLIEDGQSRYFRHTATGGFDLADLAQQTEWLLATVTTVATKYDLPLADMITVGYSNGANVAARGLLTGSLPWRTGIWFHAMSLGPLTPQPAPANATAWLSHGSQDPIVSAANFTALTSDLTTAGVATTIFRHDQQHNLNEAELTSAQQWLQQRLKEDD